MSCISRSYHRGNPDLVNKIYSYTLCGDSLEIPIGLSLPLPKPAYLKHIQKKILTSLLSPTLLWSCNNYISWPAVIFYAWLAFTQQAPPQLVNTSMLTPPFTYTLYEFILTYINKLIWYKYLQEISITVSLWLTGSVD